MVIEDIIYYLIILTTETIIPKKVVVIQLFLYTLLISAFYGKFTLCLVCFSVILVIISIICSIVLFICTPKNSELKINRHNIIQQIKIKTVKEIVDNIQIVKYIRYLRITGKIFNIKNAQGDYWYFSLKDEKAELSAMCNYKVISGLKEKLEDGVEVVVIGKINTVADNIPYSLIVKKLKLIEKEIQRP